MSAKLQSLFLLIGSFFFVSIPRAAQAEIHFTAPVPSFEQALAAAKQEGRPLVVEMSATWCEPCQSLARDLEREAAQPLLARLHLVVYDTAADETGIALKEKLKVTGIPTLIAFKSSGEEIARTTGYGSWSDMASWLRRVPTLTFSLDEVRAGADAAPRDGQRQLDVAHRLVSAKQLDKARRYFLRAEQAGPKAVAASAAWALLQFRYREQTLQLGQTLTTQLAAKYPGTREAGDALEYLAALPQPPAALESLILKQLAALATAEEMNGLAYTAMKAGAKRAAVQIAERLAPLAKDQPVYLDTLAEVAFFAEEKLDKALALSERALATAPLAEKETYKRNLERFRRNQKEPSEALLQFRAPELMPSEERPSAEHLPFPAAIQARLKLEKLLSEDCWQQAAASSGVLRVLVLAGAKPAAHRLIFPPATPKPWADCASTRIQATELPVGMVIDLATRGLPKSFDQQLAKVTQSAATDCAPLATSSELMLVLSGDFGQPPSLIFPPTESATPALRTCVEKSFAALKPPRAVLQPCTLRFNAKTH